MKKFLSLFILFLFAVQSVCCYAGEAEADNTKKILEAIKPRIGSTDEYDKFSSSAYTNELGKTVYRFNWSMKNDYDYNKYLNLSVNEDGIVTSYNLYNSDDDENHSNATINKITSNEALEKAKALLDKINPQLKDNTKLSSDRKYETLYNDGFGFDIQRYENNIPVYGDTGYINVNQNAEKILSFHINYTDSLPFENSSNTISDFDAKKAYTEKIGLKAVYLDDYEDEKVIPYIAYIPTKNNVYIDALTSDVFSPASSPILYENAYGIESAKSTADTGGLSSAEEEEIGKISGLISKEEAQKLIKSNKLLSVSSDMKLSNIRLVKTNWKNEMYKYNLSFQKEYKDSTKNKYAYATLDAKSGQLLSFNQSNNNQSDDFILNGSLAEEYIKKTVPDYYNEYKYDDEANRFVRYINNIPYYNDAINISIDSKTKKIINFSFNRTDVDFQSADGIISAKEACDKLFEQVSYEKNYMTSFSSVDAKYKDTVNLVYMFDNSKCCEIDALTGKLKDNNEDETIGGYTDISGHYAEEIINKLASFGIGFTDKEFRPNDTITEKDFKELVSSAIPEFNYSIVYKSTDKDNENNDENVNITREKAAVLLVDSMGYGDVAKLSDIYLSKFTDVNDNIGYISILSAMKIIDGYGGKFYPDKELSRADAMIIIYNYLTR